jgi:transposase InsO family protein
VSATFHAGHANSTLLVVLDRPLLFRDLGFSTVAGMRPVERSGRAALPERSDNGMVFTTRFAGGPAGRDTLNGFQALLRDLGVVQKHSKPNHPTTCGKVERFQQTLKKWLRAQPQ